MFLTFMFRVYVVLCFLCLVVNQWPGRLVSEMTCWMSSETLNPPYSLTLLLRFCFSWVLLCGILRCLIKSGFCVCSISLVESIPENLTYPDGSPLLPSIYDAWMRLIGSATKSIDIAAFYWTLTSPDLHIKDPSDWQVHLPVQIYTSRILLIGRYSV